ncbi:MAG: M48 family peptidase [Puniceicoccaceae bacterium]|nr:MAG: M48 family peptidase [Puniceicoccaceae bacterium]
MTRSGPLTMEFRTASGRIVPIEVRRRKGTRRLKLTLGLENQILASVPWRSGDAEVLRFVEKQKAWLDGQLAKAPPAIELCDWLSQVPLLSASGDLFTVRIESAWTRRSEYRFAEGGSVVLLRPEGGSEASLRRLVRNFARDALNCRVAYQAKRLGLCYDTLSVRDQSSRWGSCSARRGLSLNWRLVLLRPELQDYVILHELAHLTELNHSSRFWALLHQYDPARRENERALDALSGQIMRVARSSIAAC